MTVSVCIPFYVSDDGKYKVLSDCVNSLRGYDELIVLNGKQPSLARAINMLFKRSTEDFIIIANDDIVQTHGELRDLCIPGVVTSPMVNGGRDEFSGHIFCVPRDVHDDVGGYWEGYDGFYFDDDDYKMKIEEAGYKIQCVDSVGVDHLEGGRTLHTYPDWQAKYTKNELIFKNRWGK